ncbi:MULTISPECIES: hypothetical protein [Streptomyces]|uniref:hypothetical protein n=1 Tax=Streptomyces TaxID=1883 RepID=UPI0035DD3AB5
MNEMLAALLSGLAGLIGAGVGGWATWRAARHQANAAVTAALEQVNGQARNEETHWIRQERRQLYSKVTTARTEFETALAAWEDTPEPAHSPLYRDAENTLRRLRDACHEVATLGPDNVAQAAFKIGAAAGEVMASAIARAAVDAGQNEPETLETAAAIGEWKSVLRIAQADFTRAARSTFTSHLLQMPSS